jgi:hypothetical protein
MARYDLTMRGNIRTVFGFVAAWVSAVGIAFVVGCVVAPFMVYDAGEFALAALSGDKDAWDIMLFIGGACAIAASVIGVLAGLFIALPLYLASRRLRHPTLRMHLMAGLGISWVVAAILFGLQHLTRDFPGTGLYFPYTAILIAGPIATLVFWLIAKPMKEGPNRSAARSAPAGLNKSHENPTITRRSAHLLVGVVTVLMIGSGLILLRNDQIHRAVRALKDENGAAALAQLKPLARLGDKTAQTLVGSIYAYGCGGIPKSDLDAIYWFHRIGSFGPLVVEAGVDPAAPYELAVAKTYASGTEGVKADSAESLKWLKLAAKGGSKEAADMLPQSPR